MSYHLRSLPALFSHFHLDSLLLGIDCPVEAEATGPDPCRSEAGEHNAGGSSASTLPRQGDRLRQRLACQQDGVQHLPAIALLPSSRNHPGPALLRGH